MSRSPSRSSEDSESGSSSASSEDSLALPPPPAVAEPEAAGTPPPPPEPTTDEQEQAPADAAAPGTRSAEELANDPTRTTLFLGLGPNGRGVKPKDVIDLVHELAHDPEMPVDVRIRGRCGFADFKTHDDAKRVMELLNGTMLNGNVRLDVQFSRLTREETAERRRDRDRVRERRVAATGERPIIFVGLGPAGSSVSDSELRRKLEEYAPLAAYRRQGQCAFIEVPSPGQAERLIAEANGQYIGDCRLSVQYSRGETRRRGRELEPAGRGGPSRAIERGGDRRRQRSRSRDRRQRSHSRRRSGSRDGRRRRHRRSRSYSSRSSSGSSYHSRSRSRSRGRRSYSSRSSRSNSSERAPAPRARGGRRERDRNPRPARR